jgi:hypothetical protein
MEQTPTTAEALARLREPFASKDVKWLVAATSRDGRKGRVLAQHGGYERLPELASGIVEPYVVPASGEAALTYRGLPYNVIEDLLPHSAAWKHAAQVLLPSEDMAIGRPITPLHGSHVGLLCTAGLLNGVLARARTGISPAGDRSSTSPSSTRKRAIQRSSAGTRSGRTSFGCSTSPEKP